MLLDDGASRNEPEAIRDSCAALDIKHRQIKLPARAWAYLEMAVAAAVAAINEAPRRAAKRATKEPKPKFGSVRKAGKRRSESSDTDGDGPPSSAAPTPERRCPMRSRPAARGIWRSFGTYGGRLENHGGHERYGYGYSALGEYGYGHARSPSPDAARHPAWGAAAPGEPWAYHPDAVAFHRRRGASEQRLERHRMDRERSFSARESDGVADREALMRALITDAEREQALAGDNAAARAQRGAGGRGAAAPEPLALIREDDVGLLRGPPSG